MSIRKKIVWLPYDMDTAIGINNEGELVFGYELEDTDHLTGGADVYNGQDSVIWNNIRLAFQDELRSMYQTLRSQGKLSYEVIERAFEEHQAKWPEALFNEDSQFCYLDPLINDGTNYLAMLQGSKEEQRKWWLYNRFRYIDSKYNAGDALSDLIQLRSYAKSNITITPYADIYPTVKFGSYLVSQRGQRNVATTLVCPVDSLNDTETYIYSASQLASVGDLSGLKVGFADFSMATKLQSIKLGDSSQSYENQNLKTLTLGNNVLLQTIDVRNCTALGSGDMKVVDISGCTGIQKAYFDNTQITALTLPIGGVLDTLSLPSTVTNLTIRNQPKLESFTLQGNSYANITTCRIENTDYFLKNQTRLTALLTDMPDRSRARLVGVDIDWLADTTAIATFYDNLDRFRGLDISGGNLDNAYVEGTIHINSATGSDIAALKARYPYIEIDALHTESKLYYYNGETLLNTETILDGGDGVWTGTASKSQDAQYTYTFAGWSRTDDNTVDADAREAVVADRNVYACFTGTLRKYTVTYVKASADGGGTLQTITDVDYGTVITAASSYTGATPTTSQGSAEDYPFEGWEPASATVTGNTTFTAKFGSPVEVAEITDSWDTIIANIDNGTYSSVYKVGNYKPLDLGTEGTINMQIVAMDADELASGGTAPLTFIGMELLNTTHRMNATGTNTGGWPATEMRTYLLSTIKALIPSNVASRINKVNKTYYNYTTNSTLTNVDSLWIPSAREMFGGTSYEDSGVDYTTLFKNSQSRIKTLNGTANYYWLRSAYFLNESSFHTVRSNGGVNSSIAYIASGVCLGFCLGLEPETIEDDWSTILSNTNYATDYSIGDTKELDLGTGGKYLMEIVAIDEDDRADGNGKAGLTWISKTLLNGTHVMNATSKTSGSDSGYTAGGWENTDMRAYLKNTIKPLIPATVRNAIVEVTKIQSLYTGGSRVQNGQTTTDDVWIPSNYEVGLGTIYESQGAVYSSKFTDATSRIKKYNGSSKYWWLRSANDMSIFRYVRSDGRSSGDNASYSGGVALGFCTN